MSSKSNLAKIERVQNQALRFIDGKNLSDKIKMSSLQDKLAKKCINSIINTYSPDIDKTPVPFYK